jgi:hypothetical protein
MSEFEHDDSAERKAHEQRLRRAARRKGLRLSFVGSRDPRSVDYDQWWVGSIYTHIGVEIRGIDAVEAYLLGDEASLS